MQAPRNAILVIALVACTSMLPFATFGLDPVLLLIIPAALVAGWLAWHLLAAVQAAEPELERRLIERQYRRLAARAARVLRAESEVRP